MSNLPLVAIIDDDESVRESLPDLLNELGFSAQAYASAEEFLASDKIDATACLILDVAMPGMSGPDLARELARRQKSVPIIFITAHGTTETAIEAMKGGAFDYLVKPLDLDRLSHVLERAFEAARLMAVPALLPLDEPGDQIVGRSSVMQEMCKAVGRIAPQDVLGGFVIRAPRAYPSYVLGYEAPLSVLKEFVARFDNLQIIGRYGTFRYNNTDHSIETGLLAAKNILGESHDLDRVNAEAEYHEVKRVARAVATQNPRPRGRPGF